MAGKVDVALSVYGKPFQTALTLGSLLKHSGHHIGTVYFQEEATQPHDDEVRHVASCFPETKIEYYIPPVHIRYPGHTEYVAPTDADLASAKYRQSIRYQLAWERTDKDYLFISHNDCLYSSDIVGGMLRKLESGEYTGVGQIGQCWNCPASTAKLCDGDIYESYRPTFEEAAALVATYPSPRTFVELLDRRRPAPLPECRLNEFGCLINVAKCRHEIIPAGDIRPFGYFGLDIGTDWFKGLVDRGYRFLNWAEGMNHAPFAGGAGHPSDTDAERYHSAENRARDYLTEHYPALLDPLLRQRERLREDRTRKASLASPPAEAAVYIATELAEAAERTRQALMEASSSPARGQSWLRRLFHRGGPS